MLRAIIGILLAVLALLGAGFLSYTYLENTIGPRESVPVVVQVVPKVETTTKAVASKGLTRHDSAESKVPVKVVTKTVAGALTPVKTVTPKAVVAPGPLRVALPATTAPSGTLTMSGVMEYTNIARAQNGGLPALTGNALLGLNAQMKLQDMFARQYFEHVSPIGIGPGDLAKTVGYAYVIVGENLALGDFRSDAKLVDAWMNSPGHRANILNAHYREIGLAVGKGVYDGRETWLAVQSFGMPLSACPAIDATIKTQIDTNNSQISDIKISLDAKKAQLDGTSKDDPNYNIYVAEFNELVSPYNTLIESTRTIVETYNAGVRAHNTCISNVGTQ